MKKMLIPLVGAILLWCPLKAQVKYEAESATKTGVTVSTSLAGYSGTGYVDGFDNNADKVTFTVNVSTAGKYDLVFGYAGPMGEKYQGLAVNGTLLGDGCDKRFPASSGFTEVTFAQINLNAGNNTVEIRSCYGWFYLDYLKVSGGVSDTQLPTVPTGLTATAVTQTSFTLNWTASTDNVGVTGYEIFRNGVSIGTSPTNSFNVTGLTCGTAYSMTVRARDAAANWSVQSTAQSITTSACPPNCNLGQENFVNH